MKVDDFSKEYNAIVEKALLLAEKVHREGFLSLEEMIDLKKYYKRDILEFGTRLIIDGFDAEIVNKILTNIVNLETDTDKKILKTIQKEAVLAIQERQSQMMILLLLNSYVNIGIEEVMKKYD
ncbi:hypothetical protein LQZ19_02070 [Treponema primitia]|uniref:hypothetical protein n=1 Tax=Treponema primitia TaxID=88058 RepID=UPI00398067E9